MLYEGYSCKMNVCISYDSNSTPDIYTVEIHKNILSKTTQMSRNNRMNKEIVKYESKKITVTFQT